MLNYFVVLLQSVNCFTFINMRRRTVPPIVSRFQPAKQQRGEYRFKSVEKPTDVHHAAESNECNEAVVELADVYTCEQHNPVCNPIRAPKLRHIVELVRIERYLLKKR